MDNKLDIPKDENGIPCIFKEWQEMDPKTLGDLYSPSKYSRLFDDPDKCIEALVEFLEDKSDKTRKILTNKMGVPCGGKSNQTVDLYLPQNVKEDAPVFVFFHGGYWQFLNSASHGFVARHLVPCGVIVAVASYTLAPQGSLSDMIQECRDAVAFCAKRYPKARNFVVGGHSAGGHLAAMMLATDWERDYGLSHGLITGACPSSGLFDLRPLVTTYVNEPIGLNRETALKCSPIAHIPEIVKNSRDCKISLIYGDHEPPPFKIQNRQFNQLLREEGLDVSCIEMKDEDHFQVLENLWQADSKIVDITLKLLFPD